MFCNQCGKKVPDDSKFCEGCGSAIVAVSTIAKLSSEEENPNYIFGYRFKEGNGIGLSPARHAIEKKNDYRIIKTDLVKKDIFVYQKGNAKFAPLIIFAKKRGEVFIIGNEKGLSSIRSRYLTEKFGKPIIEKILFSEIGGVFSDLISEFSLPAGEPKEELSGVGGWLAYFIFGLFLGPVIIIISSLADFQAYSLLDIGFAIYTIYVGYLLATIKPNAVKNAKIMLVIYIVTNLFVMVMSPDTISSEEGMFNPARGLMFGVIWLLYLLNSKRVKVTYIS